MNIGDFHYDLPDELIAQQPLEHREASRMLVVDRAKNKFSDASFLDLPAFLEPDDLVVLNNTKVFPARLYGRTATGASVEIFLVNDLGDGYWEVLAKPGRRLKKDTLVIFSEELCARVAEKNDEGKIVIAFDADADTSVEEMIDGLGHTPLPPYIKREKVSRDTDHERYQTVYAKNRGAIAAPTAGLHFTPEVIDQIKMRGVEIAEIALHVGYGTFEPVRVDDLKKHSVLPEKYEIDDTTAAALNAAEENNRRIVAIGTTTSRALESNLSMFEKFTAGSYLAELTITPGYRFCAVNALLTNFHLPKSSLLVLTSVFGGHDLIMKAYAHAVAEKYRFYSYGDCMFIK